MKTINLKIVNDSTIEEIRNSTTLLASCEDDSEHFYLKKRNVEQLYGKDWKEIIDAGDMFAYMLSTSAGCFYLINDCGVMELRSRI